MWRAGVSIGAIILVGIIFAWMRWDRTVTLKFNEGELRERMEEKLPFSEDYLLIFNVELANPRIDLIDGSDRIATGLDATVSVNVGNTKIPIGGSIDVSGGIRYAANEGAFYLTDPLIDQIHLDGIPDRFANGANRALSLALSEFYRERPIYALTEEDVKQKAAKLVLRDVVVKDENLQVTLGINQQ